MRSCALALRMGWVRKLKAAGVGPSEIARQVGISRTSVFRILTAA